MQAVSKDFLQLLSHRLKLGALAKPVCRVEVDRLVFIPGRTEAVDFMIEPLLEKVIVKEWIDPVDGSYSGYSGFGEFDFVFPVEGYGIGNITSRFGPRWGRMHRGTDIGCPIGTNVLAPWPGKVVKVNHNPSNSAGLYVSVLHDNGVLTKYFHLSSIAVKKGDTVLQGQVLGKSGNTGRSTGPHLHWEVWEGVSSNGSGGRAVDGYPYMTGEKKLTGASYNSGPGSKSEGKVTGVPGEVVWSENFSQSSWRNSSRYTFYENFNKFAYYAKGPEIDADGGCQSLLFDPARHPAGATTGFTVQFKMSREGFMDVMYSADLPSGSVFAILINDRMARRVTSFEKAGQKVVLRNIYLPKGSIKVQFRVTWGGGRKGKFSFYKVMAQELVPAEGLDEFGSTKTVYKFDPTKGTTNWQKLALEEFLFSSQSEQTELQVGQFVYMDTLTLDNVISCEVNDQFEMDTQEAQVTIANVDGFYSPDYNPANFPEQFQPSPWSYWANGYHVGVLSENTPVRIFMGYGLNDIRVFTGLIDKVDEIGENGTLSFTCRGMYKKALEKVLTETKKYPDEVEPTQEKVAWVKSAVVQDLIGEAGLFGWRANELDLTYPDAIIEETYLIELNRRTGKVIKAVPGKEGEFVEEEVESIPTPYGWLNPFVTEYGKTYEAYRYKVADAVAEEIKDTNYRSYCDRYGTYRLEPIRYNRPVVARFIEGENLVQVAKTTDFSRARSHLVITDGAGNARHFLDKEILLELKGEVRTAVVHVPWAKTDQAKREVAKRMFFDMKRMCRTLQVVIPGNPALDLLDHVEVYSPTTAVRSVYMIKGIRSIFSVENGFMQTVDLTWMSDGAVV